MRKILLVLIAIVCLLTGCSKQCGFRYKTDKNPALKKNDYNSCEAIYENYTYLVCGHYSEVDFPYWENEGDTIMVCGYFSENWDGDRNHFALFDSPNNAYERVNCIEVFYASTALPMEINISKKCYVMGRLSFNPLCNSFGSYPIVPEIIGVYDIYFE